MAMTDDVNVIQLLMGIKEDVSSIKTEVADFKETQKREREYFEREIRDVREDFKNALLETDNRLTERIGNIQSIQNNVVGELDELKTKKDRADAKKWHAVLAFLAAGIGGALLARLPQFLVGFLHGN